MSESNLNQSLQEEAGSNESLTPATQIIKDLETMHRCQADLSAEKSMHYLGVLMDLYGGKDSRDIDDQLTELELLIQDRFSVYSPSSYITAFIAKIRRLETSAVRLEGVADVSVNALSRHIKD